MGGQWRVQALIELGLSDFTPCRSGAEWCATFVQFMIHVERKVRRASAKADERKPLAMYQRGDAEGTQWVRGAAHSTSWNSNGKRRRGNSREKW